MNDPLLPPFRAGMADPREGPASWCVLVLLLASFVGCALLTSALVPRDGGALLVEPQVATGTWAIDWGPGTEAPSAEQASQVGALRRVAAGVSGLLALLSLVIAVGLWRQRLRLRRAEYHVHWAVGARRLQLASRLAGQGWLWGGAVAAVGVVTSVAIPVLIAGTFPGRADVPPGIGAALILVTALAVLMLRWESRAGEGASRGGDDRLYRVVSGPVPVAAVGFAALTGVGLLTAHAPSRTQAPASFPVPGTPAVPTSRSAPQPTSDPVVPLVASVSLGAAPLEERVQALLTWIERAEDVSGPLGVASAGTTRGTGLGTLVWVDCGRCSEGGLPLPIRTVRAEVHAVTEDTFPHLGLHLIRGRDFDDALDRGLPDVAIVSEAMARRHFERGEALGRSIRLGDTDWVTVVGIVSDRSDAVDRTGYAVYLPWMQAGPDEIEILGTGSATEFSDALGSAPASARVGMPRHREEVFGVHGWFGRLLGGLGWLAYFLVLPGVWLAGWTESAATEFEVSLRKALGASRRALLRRFATSAAKGVAAFLLVGAWLSLFLGAALGRAYGAIPQVDPAVWLSSALPLSAAFVLGAWFPYVRAMRTRPASGLRSGA